jgi:ABC-type tungstate transport system permease subunit
MHIDHQNTHLKLNTHHKQNLFNMFELYIENPHIFNVQLKHMFNCSSNITKSKSFNLLRFFKIHP